MAQRSGRDESSAQKNANREGEQSAAEGDLGVKKNAKLELPFTQPFHIVAAVATLSVVVYVSRGEGGAMSKMIRLVHLLSLAAWFGAQCWVSFVAGLVMYSNLPRHTFGTLQSKLFGYYFKAGTVLLGVALLMFLLEHPIGTWDCALQVQAGSLGVSLFVVITNLVWLQPATVSVMLSKHKIEKENGAGQTVGKIEDDKLKELMKSDTYRKLSRQFIWYHSASTIFNMVAIAAELVHMWYLASHLTTV